ncbi:MAG: hypothetical protein HZB41_11735 [Ignavibacteriae bacterium]|nr:hypothetical protein [Ignavibacteriota bacterium]
MKNIDTLSSLDGRATLAEVYNELRFEKQLSNFSTLLICWRICVRERELFRYVKKDVTVLHPLGIFSGTGLWMEEILNRYYFTTINSFVYFGAAILLVLIGLRRFTNYVNPDIVLGGVAFEALMLIFMFVVMLFTPSEELETLKARTNENQNTIEDLIVEVGEISRDFAAVVVQLEKLSDSFQEVLKQQSNLTFLIGKLSDNYSDASAPNPQMLEIMKETNFALSEFKNTVNNLNNAAELLKREEIEIAVRKEVERVLVNKLTQ